MISPQSQAGFFARTALLLALCAAVAAAQATVAQVAVGAGSVTDVRGVHSNAVSLSPSVTITLGNRTNAALGGDATRFGSGASSLTASAAFATRSATAAGVSLTLDATASATNTSFGASYATGDVTPAIQWSWHAVTLYGGAHAASGYMSAGRQQAPIPLPGTTQLVSETRSSYAPVFGGVVEFGADETGAVALSYREEPMRIAGVAVTDRTAGARFAAGPLTIAGSAGRRSAVDERADFATGSLSLALSDAVSFEAGGGSYPSNRLTGGAAGNFLSAGFTVHFGGSALSRAPAPAGVAAPAPGVTRLAIRAPDAQRVAVAGDWNHWEPEPATRSVNGVWYVDVTLDPGEYRYAFRIDGSAWRVPEGTLAVDDGFGGKSAYVTVRGSDTAQSHHSQEER